MITIKQMHQSKSPIQYWFQCDFGILKMLSIAGIRILCSLKFTVRLQDEDKGSANANKQ